MWLLENLELYAPERVGARSLLIGGGKLLRVLNPGERAPDGWNVRSVDCGGRSVVPGFVDSHVHITGGGGESGARSKVPALQLSRYTRCGVTSVVGLLGTDDTTRSTAELLARARTRGGGAFRLDLDRRLSPAADDAHGIGARRHRASGSLPGSR